MNKIDVIHRDKKVGELEVLDHIRLPFEPQLQLIFDMSLRSRNFLYKPSRGDFTLEERDGKSSSSPLIHAWEQAMSACW